MSTAKSSAGVTKVAACESSPATESVMFGAGCFWGVEAAFAKIDGVVETAVGYSGGEIDYPSYEQVCTDTTGHAEVVRLNYDPTKVSFRELIEAFFELHDPTQMNRQGPDHGSQYRSAIFYCNDDQKQAAEAVTAELTESGRHPRPIVTKIEPAQTFWRAEEYHQQYLMKNRHAICSI